MSLELRLKALIQRIATEIKKIRALAISTSSDLGGSGASDQAVPSQKAVKTYVDDNYLPLSGGVINGDLATNGQYFAIKADFAKGTVPDTNKYYQLSVADNSGDYNAGHRFGCFNTIVGNDGSVTTNIHALKNVANQSSGTSVGITVKSDGTQSWHCPQICEQKERRADVNNSIVRIYGGATNPTSNVWYQSAIELCGWENTSFPGWVAIHSGDGTTGHYLTLRTENSKGVVETNGSMILTKNADAGETSFNYPPLVIGNPTSVHIEYDANEIVSKGSNTTLSPIYIHAGNATATSSAIGLFAKSIDNTVTTALELRPGTANGNGSLTWGGKEIERIDSSGTNWIRYVNGIQICWGYVACNPTNQTSGRYYQRSTITYPVAFKSTPECILTPYDSNSGSQNPWCSCIIESPTATKCTAFVWSMTTSPSGTIIKVSYIAFGYWK